MPTASDLRYKINLLEQDDSNIGYGEPAYTAFASGVWANVEDLHGLELIREQKIAAKVTHRVTVRYRASVLANMRITFEGKTFFIEAVLDRDKPRKVWLTLLCSELQAR